MSSIREDLSALHSENMELRQENAIQREQINSMLTVLHEIKELVSSSSRKRTAEDAELQRYEEDHFEPVSVTPFQSQGNDHHQFLPSQGTPIRNAFSVLGKSSGVVPTYVSLRKLFLSTMIKDWYKYELMKEGKFTKETHSDVRTRIKAAVEFAITIAPPDMLDTMTKKTRSPGESGYNEQEVAKTKAAVHMQRIAMKLIFAAERKKEEEERASDKSHDATRNISSNNKSSKHMPYISAIEKRLGCLKLKGKKLEEITSYIGSEKTSRILRNEEARLDCNIEEGGEVSDDDDAI